MTDPVGLDGQIAIIPGAAAIIGATPLRQSALSDARIVAADVLRQHGFASKACTSLAAAPPLAHFNS